MSSSRSRVARRIGVHDELIARAAGDLDAAREGLEPERAARRHRQRAVDGFGIAGAAGAVVVSVALGAGRARRAQGEKEGEGCGHWPGHVYLD